MSDTQTQQSPYETRTSWELLVNGAYNPAPSGGTFDVINPATNETLTNVAQTGRAVVAAAASAACARARRWNVGSSPGSPSNAVGRSRCPRSASWASRC